MRGGVLAKRTQTYIACVLCVCFVTLAETPNSASDFAPAATGAQQGEQWDDRQYGQPRTRAARPNVQPHPWESPEWLPTSGNQYQALRERDGVKRDNRGYSET